jgi:aminoglycoside 6'-N-acetyltransferase
MKVGSVVIDCNDFERMAAFWQEALHYVPREAPEEGWVVLRDPSGGNVNVSLQKVPERRSGKNRLHLDLYTEDPHGEVDRLLRIGATRHARKPEPGEDFTVLEDPEGNLFCVIDKRETAASGTGALTGAEVTLRALTPEDVEVLRAIRAEPPVARWWGPLEEDFPLGDAPDVIRYTILLEDRPIGMIQFSQEVYPDYRWADVDIFIASAHQGRGLGSDAMRTLIHHLQVDLGHHRVTLTTSPDNDRAISVYEKLGFRTVGILTLSTRDPVSQQWTDELLMELVIPPGD